MLKKLDITKEISMSQNHSKVNDRWDEWQDNNSPIHNEAICPLFYTETKSGNAKAMDQYGNYYEVGQEGSLNRNGEFIAHVENRKFVRTELDYKGNLCEWYNGHLYTGVRNDDIIKIYEDGNLVETVYAEDSPLCERLYHGKYFGVYLQTLSSTGTFNFYGWSKSHIGGFGAQAIFDNPAIFVHDDIACVSPSTGSSLKANNLLSVFFYNDVANNEIKALGAPWVPAATTINVPSVSTNLLVSSSFSVSSSYTSETKTCYLGTDNYYYDEVSGVRLTFETGYKPVYTGNSNYYRYNVITTVFTYTGNVTNTANLSSKMNVVVPNETSWSWDFDGNTTTSTRTLSFTTNFGPKTLEIPDVTVRCNNTEWPIPRGAIQKHTNVQHNVIYQTAATSVYVVRRGMAWIMLDDGKFYNIIEDQKCQTWGAFQGYMLDWYWTGQLHQYEDEYGNIQYQPIVNGTKACFFGATYPDHVRFRYDVGHGNFIRFAGDMHLSADDGTTFQPKDTTWNWGYDAYIGVPFLDCGLRLNGNDSTKFDIPYGSKPNVLNKFTPLINNGYINGISYNSILVTPWQSIDTAVPYSKDDNNLVYRDVDTNTWIKVSIADGTQIRLIENRYLVINTTSTYNCYDTETSTVQRFANDYNQRLWYGDDYYAASHNVDYNENLISASAMNAGYKVSGNTNGIASTIWSAVLAYNVKHSTYSAYKSSRPTTDDMVGVDYYELGGPNIVKLVAPEYKGTFKFISTYKNYVEYTKSFLLRDKARLYPLYESGYIYRNPSIFADYIYSGNNEDYFIDGAWAYKLVYTSANVTPVMLSQTVGDARLPNMSAMFVIQSMPFSVIDGKIYSLNYTNGSYQGRECIIDTSAMYYIGNTPLRAYFYSPNNRGIYTFTGDANLSKLRDASAVSEVYRSWYNPSTQTIFFSTNDGLYMQNDISSYKQQFYDVKDIVFLKDGSTAIIDGDTLYRLYYEDAEGRKTNQVRLNTGLLGAGNNEVFTIRKWYFTLFSDQRRNGKFRIKSFVMRDDGKIEEHYWDKEITSNMWDKEFNCAPISYPPANGRGVGVGVEILSDFAISDITIDADIQNTGNRAGSKFKM